MSDKGKLIGLGAITIIAICLLVAFTLPLSDLVFDNNDEIAIIPINGEISYDNHSKNHISIENIENGIKDANKNPSVKAIVIEINSQGGSLVASEEIAKLIKSSKKPTVAWISDCANSEAYLIASSADTIVATPSSVIGINSVNNNLDKSKSMLKQDKKYLIKLIAKNRGLKVNQVSKIAKSEYNGKKALNIKLIDKVGDKDKAIKIASSKANLTYYTVINYPKDQDTQLTSFLNNKMNSKEEVDLNLTLYKLKKVLDINNLNKLNIQ